MECPYNMTEFLRYIEELFDIFCNDQKQRRKPEINKFKINKDDFAFYEDQIGPRKRKCLDVVEPTDQSDINFLQKMSQKQYNSNNTVLTTSANIDILLGFASDTSTCENSEISVSFDSALPCSSKSILQQNRVTLKIITINIITNIANINKTDVMEVNLYPSLMPKVFTHCSLFLDDNIHLNFDTVKQVKNLGFLF